MGKERKGKEREKKGEIQHYNGGTRNRFVTTRTF